MTRFSSRSSSARVSLRSPTPPIVVGQFGLRRLCGDGSGSCAGLAPGSRPVGLRPDPPLTSAPAVPSSIRRPGHRRSVPIRAGQDATLQQSLDPARSGIDLVRGQERPQFVAEVACQAIAESSQYARSSSVRGWPRQRHSTVRSFGSIEKQRPLSMPWTRPSGVAGGGRPFGRRCSGPRQGRRYGAAQGCPNRSTRPDRPNRRPPPTTGPCPRRMARRA